MSILPLQPLRTDETRTFPESPEQTRAYTREPFSRHATLAILSFSARVLCALNVVMAGAVSFQVYVHGWLNSGTQWQSYTAVVIMGMAISQLMFEFFRVFSSERTVSASESALRLVAIWTLTIFVLFAIGFILKVSIHFSRVWVVLWYFFACVGFLLLRVGVPIIVEFLNRRGTLLEKVLLVGQPTELQRFHTLFSQKPLCEQFNVVGSFEWEQLLPENHAISHPGLTTALLREEVSKKYIDHILVLSSPQIERDLPQALGLLQQIRADLSLAISAQLPFRGVRHIGKLSLFNISEKPMKDWAALFKRVEDIILSCILISVVSPMMLIVGAAIWLESGFPIVFRQKRFGLNGQPITVLKFRTMYYDKCDLSGGKRTILDDPRVTRVGRWLRKFSLDELPQLFNVVKGEMSLVGPRAHPTEMLVGDQYYHDLISTYAMRHHVKPGITGLAQVNGHRGEVDSMDKARERLIQDLRYIETWSIWSDCKILVRTLACFITNRGY